MHDLIQMLYAQPGLWWWVAGLSALIFVASLVALPWIIVRLPADYFARRGQRGTPLLGRAPTSHWLIAAGKNLAGALLVVMGLLMLVLPGQGILTILAGLLLMNFPGKYRLERWLVSRRPVWRAIRWLRARAGRPPLEL